VSELEVRRKLSQANYIVACQRQATVAYVRRIDALEVEVEILKREAVLWRRRARLLGWLS
jgi:hypothetical protein